jgi:hypothetical protein
VCTRGTKEEFYAEEWCVAAFSLRVQCNKIMSFESDSFNLNCLMESFDSELTDLDLGALAEPVSAQASTADNGWSILQELVPLPQDQAFGLDDYAKPVISSDASWPGAEHESLEFVDFVDFDIAPDEFDSMLASVGSLPSPISSSTGSSDCMSIASQSPEPSEPSQLSAPAPAIAPGRKFVDRSSKADVDAPYLEYVNWSLQALRAQFSNDKAKYQAIMKARRRLKGRGYSSAHANRKSAKHLLSF